MSSAELTERRTERQAKQRNGLGNGATTAPDSPPLGAKSTGPAITLTRFTNARGASLTKRLFLDTRDALDSDKTAMVMSSGSADRVVVDGVAGLGVLIETLKLSQAISLGALRADLPDMVEVATKRGGATARRG